MARALKDTLEIPEPDFFRLIRAHKPGEIYFAGTHTGQFSRQNLILPGPLGGSAFFISLLM
jgi:hypothetical protein